MANEASDDTASVPEARVSWFRAGGERPVNGGGNTVFVRPADEDPVPMPVPHEK